MTAKGFDTLYYSDWNRDVVLSDEEKRRAWPGFIMGLDRNVTGVGVHYFSNPDSGMADLSDEQFAQLVEAMGKPMRLTPTQKNRAIAVFGERGLTGSDLKAWANENSTLKANWRGQEVSVHFTRKIAFAGEVLSPHNKDMGYTVAVAEKVAEWKEAGQPKALPTDRNPRHAYGAKFGGDKDGTRFTACRAMADYDQAQADAAYYDNLAATRPRKGGEGACRRVPPEGRPRGERTGPRHDRGAKAQVPEEVQDALRQVRLVRPRTAQDGG